MKRHTTTFWFGTFAGLLLAAAISGSTALAQSPPVSGTSAVAASGPAATGTVTEDIRDIRGPEPIASPWPWIIGAAAGMLFAGGAYFGWRRLQRREPAPRTSLQEAALAQLEAARALMRPESVRAFSIAVSDAVRSYIEQRFLVLAAHRTTEEFLRSAIAPSDALLASQSALLAEFLSHCDLAKFGGWTWSPEAMDEMYRSARTFIQATGPSVPAPAPAPNRGPPPSSADKDLYASVSSA